MIKTLISKGFAYVSSNKEISIKKFKKYGSSSSNWRSGISGSRVNVAEYKNNPGDFILWKPSSNDQPGWESPWGKGRPGWHIECSAMSKKYLGNSFDIHGGGIDLIFPHHENEIAQSCCSNNSKFLLIIGFIMDMLRVNGEKMSKSLGNFSTINNLLLNYRLKI